MQHPRSAWIVITDWLGAQKPLNLIFGAVLAIQMVALLVRAL